MVGTYAGYALSGSYNVAVGKSALDFTGANSSNNTAVGYDAGHSSSGSGNVFIGHQVGHSQTVSDQLFIDNSNTSSPLIHGDFSTDHLTVNGDLTVTGRISSETEDVAFHVYHASTQNPGTTGWVDVVWDTEVFDDGDNFASDKFTAPIDGVYHFSTSVLFSSMDVGSVWVIALNVNGTLYRFAEDPSATTGYFSASGSMTLKLLAGDTVGVTVYSSTDPSYNIRGGNTYTHFSGHLVY